jgi:2-iminobutanoate/2-iminopropanoate deaminase
VLILSRKYTISQGNFGDNLNYLGFLCNFEPLKSIAMSQKIVNSKNAPAPIGPYSQAVLSNGTLYVSGQIAINPASGDLVLGEIVRETHQVMNNLKAILNEAGMDFSNVVKCSIFVKDLSNFATINQVYGEYFTSNPPARETVEVSRLPKDVNVEISCIAVA